MNAKMKSHKPYLVNAYRDWLEDNNFTAVGVFLVKDTVAKVPIQLVCLDSGLATIEISSVAASNLTFDGENLLFNQIIDGGMMSFSIPLDLTVMLKPKEIKDNSIHMPFEVSNCILEKYSQKPKFNGLRLV